MERVQLCVRRNIVHAVDAADCGQLILNVIQHGIVSLLVVADRQRTGIILIEHPGDDVLRNLIIMGDRTIVAALGDLIADRPHDDAWIIDAAADHGASVKFAPLHAGLAADDLVVCRNGLFKVRSVIIDVSVLILGPAVECFVDDEHAVLIADVEQDGCGRVVRHADRVAAHFLQDAHLTLDSVAIRDRAQRSLVVVHAHALSFIISPFSEKPVSASKLK